MEIVLVHPEIPQNTGNIVRTCSATDTCLTLVKPLGFSLSDRWLKRAGLDYWDDVNIKVIDDLKKYLQESRRPFYFFSSHAKPSYSEIEFTEDAIMIFGSETKGLPPQYLETWPEQFYTIPMKSQTRCLNLSNAAAIVIYEALRQTDFAFFFVEQVHEKKTSPSLERLTGGGNWRSRNSNS